MRHFLSHCSALIAASLHALPPTTLIRRSLQRWSTSQQWQTALLTLGLGTSLAGIVISTPVRAQNPAKAAPAELTTLLNRLDAAANSHNPGNVAGFYSPNFTHSDGLGYQTLQNALTALWKRYPNLNYRTELKSWKADGTGILVETVTYITGTQREGNHEYKLSSTLGMRHRVENQKIVRQEILNERSQLTAGANPPTLKINLPEEVRAGQEFTFDAIVQEPLGDDLLIGTALEEAVKPEGYLNVTTANLEALPSGGIFKVGKAPTNSENHWLSAVVVRHDGITMVTQRLRIIGRK